MSRLLFVFMLMIVSALSYSQSWKVYPYKPEGSLISFPADEGHQATRHQEAECGKQKRRHYLRGDLHPEISRSPDDIDGKEKGPQFGGIRFRRHSFSCHRLFG